MFDDRTRDNIKAEILAELDTSTGLTALEGGFADQVYGPVAVKLEEFYAALQALVAFVVLDETCGALLDVAGDNLGLLRKEGRRAKAGITLTGTAGAVIPAGTVFLTEEGLEFALDTAVRLDAEGKGTGALTAQAVGAAYNVGEGEIVRMYVNLATLTAFSNTQATGGADPENGKELYGRIHDRTSAPATSGNPAQVRQWATEVDGVAYAKVVSLVNGRGTVGVTLVGPDMAPVDATVVAAVVANIKKYRIVGMDIDPYVVSAEPLTVNIEAVSKLDTGTQPEEVARHLSDLLGAYFASLVEAKYSQIYEGPDKDAAYSLRFNRVATMLMTTPGVLDYTTLTINGKPENLTIGANQVPVLGEVTVLCS